MHQDTIDGKIEVGVSLGWSVLEREHEGVNIFAPKWWGMFEAVKCLL